jgi:hypothetical protein
MPTTTAGHLVPEILRFTTDTFKQKSNEEVTMLQLIGS